MIKRGNLPLDISRFYPVWRCEGCLLFIGLLGFWPDFL